jgi:glycosyltransferase involved in cell wall biosynthesis
MKEILILSYFYPPCTLTAAQRPAGWVKHFYDYGFRPIVITRNWDLKITKQEDQLRDAGKEVVIDNSEKFEIHYLPYKASLRDRIFNSSNPILKKGSKLLTFINSIGENYSNRFIPFSNFYDYASKLIEERKTNLLIITANPFIQFRFGYLLHKKYGISWIADYRDDWTTSEIIKPTSFVEKILFSFQQTSEKKWVKTASFITSVSEVYTKRISKFVGVRGETILNGFDELYPIKQNQDNQNFIITYNGSLYHTQDVEGFIQSIKKCIDYFAGRIFIRVQFPGVAYDPLQEKRILNLILGYEKHFLLTDRIPKKEVIQLQRHSDLLLMLTHLGTKGIPSSKLYEYLAIQKPILCYPSDFDIVEQTISAVGNGIIVNDLNQLFTELKIIINAKILKEELFTNIELNKRMSFSIKKQVSVLANSLTHI